MARPHTSGNRGHSVAGALTEPQKQRHHWQILVPAACTGHSIPLRSQTDERVRLMQT